MRAEFVFLLWAHPTDPYEAQSLISVHGSLEGAKRAGERDPLYPVHPWGRPQDGGVLWAKARGDGIDDLIIRPMRVKP